MPIQTTKGGDQLVHSHKLICPFVDSISLLPVTLSLFKLMSVAIKAGFIILLVYEVYRWYIVIPPVYEVYRGYIVFAFSVCVCLCVCVFVNFFFRQRFLRNYLT